MLHVNKIVMLAKLCGFSASKQLLYNANTQYSCLSTIPYTAGTATAAMNRLFHITWSLKYGCEASVKRICAGTLCVELGSQDPVKKKTISFH